MVSINVARLLQSAPGSVRDVDFSELLPDPSPDIHLLGPVSGRARLTLTSRGVLVLANLHAVVALECARCLDDVPTEISGVVEEEFVPSTDVRSGLPTAPDPDLVHAQTPRIDEHHEINLDEPLRQTLLTDTPLRVLCDTACPGLCPECGLRLDTEHEAHAEAEATPDVSGSASPFAALAELLAEDSPRK
jgi:uncharacterized metal-binding protein YceD (DUF177 family)